MQLAEATGTRVRLLSVRPRSYVYEHMFWSSSSTPAQRMVYALRLTRSFLMLEDDYDVDWEVDRNGQGSGSHPHRQPLRGRGPEHRRPGQTTVREQVCVSPLDRPVHAAQGRSRSRRSEARSEAHRAGVPYDGAAHETSGD